MPEMVGDVNLINAQGGLLGTNGYCPPEFSNGHYSVRSDVYSLGVGWMVDDHVGTCDILLVFMLAVFSSYNVGRDGISPLQS